MSKISDYRHYHKNDSDIYKLDIDENKRICNNVLCIVRNNYKFSKFENIEFLVTDFDRDAQIEKLEEKYYAKRDYIYNDAEILLDIYRQRYIKCFLNIDV